MQLSPLILSIKDNIREDDKLKTTMETQIFYINSKAMILNLQELTNNHTLMDKGQ